MHFGSPFVRSVLLSTKVTISSLSYLRVPLKSCATARCSYLCGSLCCYSSLSLSWRNSCRVTNSNVLTEVCAVTAGAPQLHLCGSAQARAAGCLLGALQSQAFYPGTVAKPCHATSMFRIYAINTSFALNLVFLGSSSGHSLSLI